MLRYAFSRILAITPNLVGLSLAAFLGIQALMPFDKEATRLPLFYFSIYSHAQPDTFYRFSLLSDRETVRHYGHYFGNWEDISLFLNAKKLALEELGALTPGEEWTPRLSDQLMADLRSLDTFPAPSFLAEKLQVFQGRLETYPETSALKSLAAVSLAYQHMQKRASPWKSFLPRICWHGTQNTYHHWHVQVWQTLFPDSGHIISTRTDNRFKDLKDALSLTLTLSLFATVWVLGASFCLAIAFIRRPRSPFLKGLNAFLFLLDAIPAFFILFILLVIFSQLDLIGPNLIPSRFDKGNPFSYIVVVMAVSLGGLAFWSRMLRAVLLETQQRDYIRTAKAKGVPDMRIWLHHLLRNALIPIVAIFAGILPSLIEGSLVIEQLYIFKGMSSQLMDDLSIGAALSVFIIVMLNGVLTYLGYLLADLASAKLDPRISLGNKSLGA